MGTSVTFSGGDFTPRKSRIAASGGNMGSSQVFASSTVRIIGVLSCQIPRSSGISSLGPVITVQLSKVAPSQPIHVS